MEGVILEGMRVDSLISTGSQLILRSPTVQERRGVQGKEVKTLGETPPVVLDLSEIGKLATLFAPGGIVERLRRRLNHLKQKKCKIVPAKGTVACVDDNDVVYLGVEFLERYQNERETLAGVLAHEWGHACALKPDREDLEKLNWNQIFDLRRAHETLADETSGRLLFLMGYKPDGVVQFLKKGKSTHNLKYHHPEIREQIILYGFASEKRKSELAKQLFPNSTYDNVYSSVLLDIV